MSRSAEDVHLVERARVADLDVGACAAALDRAAGVAARLGDAVHVRVRLDRRRAAGVDRAAGRSSVRVVDRRRCPRRSLLPMKSPLFVEAATVSPTCADESTSTLPVAVDRRAASRSRRRVDRDARARGRVADRDEAAGVHHDRGARVARSRAP